jgi:hypothetical protein
MHNYKHGSCEAIKSYWKIKIIVGVCEKLKKALESLHLNTTSWRRIAWGGIIVLLYYVYM